ncbi:MAG: hypothetical protein LBL66_06790 [Clostridiales bacterium]|nr:hypothetical protein [Clostridiales bacterium]
MTGQFTMHNAQFTISVEFIHSRHEGHGRRVRIDGGKRVGVPLFGRDCRVALRAPRNDPAERSRSCLLMTNAKSATTPPPLAAPLR